MLFIVGGEEDDINDDDGKDPLECARAPASNPSVASLATEFFAVISILGCMEAMGYVSSVATCVCLTSCIHSSCCCSFSKSRCCRSCWLRRTIYPGSSTAYWRCLLSCLSGRLFVAAIEAGSGGAMKEFGGGCCRCSSCCTSRVG